MSDGSQDTILSPYSIILVSHCGELYILRQRGLKKIRLGMSMLYVFYTSLKEKMAKLPSDKGNIPVDTNVTDTNSDIVIDRSVSKGNRNENDEEYQNDDVTMTLDEGGDIIPISREDSNLNYTVDNDSKISRSESLTNESHYTDISNMTTTETHLIPATCSDTNIHSSTHMSQLASDFDSTRKSTISEYKHEEYRRDVVPLDTRNSEDQDSEKEDGDVVPPNDSQSILPTDAEKCTSSIAGDTEDSDVVPPNDSQSILPTDTEKCTSSIVGDTEDGDVVPPDDSQSIMPTDAEKCTSSIMGDTEDGDVVPPDDSQSILPTDTDKCTSNIVDDTEEGT